MELQLFRQSDNGKQTLGMIEANGKVWYTVELPWKDNERRVSCIPPGTYQMIQHYSPKFGPCYWLQDVPGRSEILIHPANYYSQLLGCIAPGMNRADINGDGEIDVTSSRKAVGELLELNATSITIHGIS
jgi:hypothetical protein